MEFLNRTCYPDKQVYQILLKSASVMKSDISNVFVFMTRDRLGCNFSGFADVNVPSDVLLKTTSNGSGYSGQYIRLMVPRLDRAFVLGSKKLVRLFFEIVLHEWFHIREFQTDYPKGYPLIMCRDKNVLSSGKRSRRLNWAKRPEEVRAVAAVSEMLDRRNILADFGVSRALFDLENWIDRYWRQLGIDVSGNYNSVDWQRDPTV